MNVFKIPDSLEKKYKGSGYALAASLNGVLVDIKYLSDVYPDISISERNIKRIIVDEKIGPTVRELQAIGNVHVGIISCWEFVEL